jgi:hypothetical protein
VGVRPPEFPDAAAVVEWAERTATDANRRIKLRRIAMENLAGVL